MTAKRWDRRKARNRRAMWNVLGLIATVLVGITAFILIATQATP